jgi:hypothetical protein
VLGWFFICLFFEAKSRYKAQAGQTPKLGVSCLKLPSAGITGMCHLIYLESPLKESLSLLCRGWTLGKGGRAEEGKILQKDRRLLK